MAAQPPPPPNLSYTDDATMLRALIEWVWAFYNALVTTKFFVATDDLVDPTNSVADSAKTRLLATLPSAAELDG